MRYCTAGGLPTPSCGDVHKYGFALHCWQAPTVIQYGPMNIEYLEDEEMSTLSN